MAPRTDRRILLIRHGQTEWSLSDQHTGRTDIALTDRGASDATGLRGILMVTVLVSPHVISSPRTRARRTAELADLPVDEVSELFAEWDYGDYEGLTRERIRADHDPDWTIWSKGGRNGESVEDMLARVDAAIAHVDALLTTKDVVVVSHGHFSRSFIGRYLGWPITCGANIDLRPAGSALLTDTDRDRRLSQLIGPVGSWASASSI